MTMSVYAPQEEGSAPASESAIEHHRNRLWLAARAMAKILSADPAVVAVYAGGSLISGEVDAFSDLDLCCVASPHALVALMDRVPGLLSAYAPVEYILAMPNQSVTAAVFRNGIRIDLMLNTGVKENTWERIEVLYDPNQLLSDYAPRAAALREQEVRHAFNGIALLVRDIDVMRRRGEFVQVSVCLGRLLTSVALLYRHATDPARGRYGAKKLSKCFVGDDGERFASALRLLTPDTCVAGVTQLVDIATDALKGMGDSIPSGLNFSFLEGSLRNLQGKPAVPVEVCSGIQASTRGGSPSTSG